ncbi:MAG: metallophosphoesterase [Patescibacteria group bacterium]
MNTTPTLRRILFFALITSLFILFIAAQIPRSENFDKNSISSNFAPTVSNDPVLYAVGDIADCDRTEDEATAALLTNTQGSIAILGDSAYLNGGSEEYQTCFDPAWGIFSERLLPAPGNHDYRTPGAAGYFGYFGDRAGENSHGFYSTTIGAWRIIALNSNCEVPGIGCTADSPQAQWLKEQLAKSDVRCTLAFMHHPRFSSGNHGNTEAVQPLWNLLYQFNADLVLAGHDHNYERFSPQTPDGTQDPARGLREFVVGTGGAALRNFNTPEPQSEIRNSTHYGVLKLTLHSKSYDWEFLSSIGDPAFSDRGTAGCH